MKDTTSNKSRKKVFMMFVFFIVMFLAIVFRFAYLQVFKGNDLQAKAQSLQIKEIPIAAKRGDICDRNNKKLAVSINADSVCIFPQEIKKADKEEAVAKVLSENLEIEKKEILKAINSDSQFKWIKRKVDFDKAKIIKKADLPGVEVVEETQRFYPNDMLGAHILGFASIDNKGLDGIEVMKDKTLSGEEGIMSSGVDIRGREVPQIKESVHDAQDGKNILLTIDDTIQYYAEQELDKLMASASKPKKASILIMNPKTGEILAMASRPAYDPNEYQQYEASVIRNPSVTDSYEPGSTFKIVTGAIGLEEGVTSENDGSFFDKGYVEIGKDKIRCWRNKNPHGAQTFSQIVQNSCNPGFVDLGLRIEKKEKGLLNKKLKEFGFGSKTNIELPGESSGIMFKDEDVKKINVATMSMGQGISVTQLQLVTAVSAVVNGGNLLKPQIVYQVKDQEGNLVEDFKPEVVKRVVSEETSATMRRILNSVVIEGTGAKADIPGYNVGGKTGTAQKVGKGGYLNNKFIASFIGIAPIEDPELVVLVVVDEPQGAVYQGGQIAAPIFESVTENTLHYLGVPADNEDQTLERKNSSSELESSAIENTVAQKTEEEVTKEKNATVPNVINASGDKVESILRMTGFNSNITGDGNVVIKQNPSGGSSIAKGTKIDVLLGDASKNEDENKVTVPNLANYRLGESVKILKAMNLKIKSKGTGYLVKQNPTAGSKVSKGSVVELTFVNDN